MKARYTEYSKMEKEHTLYFGRNGWNLGKSANWCSSVEIVQIRKTILVPSERLQYERYEI